MIARPLIPRLFLPSENKVDKSDRVRKAWRTGKGLGWGPVSRRLGRS